MRKSRHTIIFLVINMSIVLFGVLPWTFDWTNRIEPWIFSLPFSIFCLVLLNVLNCVLMAIWYVVDSKKGYLDFDIDQVDKEEGVL